MSKDNVSEKPMKWFKFLIYFLLWASAVVNILGAIPYIAGTVYDYVSEGVTSADVYALYPALRAVDIIYGIIVVAISFFAIFTRYRLADYKKNGPLCLYIFYGSIAGLNLIYPLLTTIVTGENCFTVSVITSIIVGLAMTGLNYIYFNKRKELFIN